MVTLRPPPSGRPASATRDTTSLKLPRFNGGQCKPAEYASVVMTCFCHRYLGRVGVIGLRRCNAVRNNVKRLAWSFIYPAGRAMRRTACIRMNRVFSSKRLNDNAHVNLLVNRWINLSKRNTDWGYRASLEEQMFRQPQPTFSNNYDVCCATLDLDYLLCCGQSSNNSIRSTVYASQCRCADDV